RPRPIRATWPWRGCSRPWAHRWSPRTWTTCTSAPAWPTSCTCMAACSRHAASTARLRTRCLHLRARRSGGWSRRAARTAAVKCVRAWSGSGKCSTTPSCGRRRNASPAATCCWWSAPPAWSSRPPGWSGWRRVMRWWSKSTRSRARRVRAVSTGCHSMRPWGCHCWLSYCCGPEAPAGLAGRQGGLRGRDFHMAGTPALTPPLSRGERRDSGASPRQCLVVHAGHRAAGGVCHLREARVPGDRRRRGAGDRLAAGHRLRRGLAGEVALEDRAVEIRLLGLRRVDREALVGRGQFAVGDLRLGVRLEPADPAVAHAVAELLLLPPQDLRRQVAVEGGAQDAPPHPLRAG